MDNIYGAIEAGGTKFVCAVGNGPENLHVRRFDTTVPEETLPKVVGFLREEDSRDELTAIGVGSFGPVDLNRHSDTYGHITSTPKLHWSHTDIVGLLESEFGVPVGFDTDVNAAALGEHRWGKARGLTNFVYLTVGTGIGGGGMLNGELMHGLVHPEMGHIFIPSDPRDEYAGKCPFHGNRCFEGLASGPAIEERWGKPARDLDYRHKAWHLEAHYVSLALVNYICTLSPQRIIIGGGVMEQKQLFRLIRENVGSLLNDYIQSPEILGNIDGYIVPPGLGGRAGVLGAMALAMRESGL